MSELTSQSASALVRLIADRSVSPVEVMKAHLAVIAQVNPQLNAIVTLAPDLLEQAAKAEAAVIRGDALGPLHGLPVTIKDTIETAGLRTTSGSLMRADFVPASDAPAARLSPTALARFSNVRLHRSGRLSTPMLSGDSKAHCSV